MRILLYFSIYGLLSVFLFAQESGSPVDRTATGDTLKVQNSSPSNVKLFIEKIEVEGRLEKPQAVFILPGQTPAIDDIQIERSFLSELLRPVEIKRTFETVHSPTFTRLRKDVLDW